MRFISTLFVLAILAASAQAQCANGVCPTSRAKTFVVPNAPATVAPSRVVARSTVHARQTVQARRLAVRHR